MSQLSKTFCLLKTRLPGIARTATICLLLALTVVAVRSPSVLAANGSNLTTSPVSVSLSTTPGQAAQTTLQLQNNGPQAISIAVRLEKFRSFGEDGQAQIYTPIDNDPSLSWVHFSRTVFTANPGVWNQVKMTIDTPETAAFGYYYAVVFAPVTNNAPVPGINTFHGANAVLVLLNVHVPGERNQLKIAQFTASQNVYQFLPATFSIKVHNSGDIYTAPRGSIYISSGEDSPAIATLDVNRAQGNVLPGTNRVFQVDWDSGFPNYVTKRLNGQIVSDKNGNSETELNWDLSKLSQFRFGRYVARLVLVYNDGTRDIPLAATVSFWVIPWTILLVTAVLLALIGVGLTTIIRGVIRRRPRRIHLR